MPFSFLLKQNFECISDVGTTFTNPILYPVIRKLTIIQHCTSHTSKEFNPTLKRTFERWRTLRKMAKFKSSPLKNYVFSLPPKNAETIENSLFVIYL